MAKIRLTERNVGELVVIDRGGDDRETFWDTQLKGFGIVVSSTGRKAFVARVRPPGSRKLIKRTIGTFGQPRDDGRPWTVMLARHAAHDLLGPLRVGKVVPTHSSAGGPTLRKALELHLEKMERGENRRRKPCSPGSIETLRTTVEHHLADHLDEPLMLLTADKLDAIVKRIESAAATVTKRPGANPPGRATGVRLLANVSAIWNTWEKRHGLPIKNPCARLTPAALKPRDERIATAALPSWYTTVCALPPIRRDLQLVSMFTGVREDGLRHIRHEDVDLEAGLLHVTHAKGDKPYTVPLTETLRKIFEARARDNVDQSTDTGKWLAPYATDGERADGGWVFPSVSRDGERVIPIAETKQRRVRKDAKEGEPATERVLAGTHANRRTYNSVAMEVGVMKEFRDALMNHENRGVNVKHYGRPETWEHLAKQAAIIEAALWSRIRATPSSTEKPKHKAARGHLRSVPR